MLAGTVAFLAGSPVHARPAYRKTMQDYFGPFLAKKLNDCRTCHVPAPEGASADDERPHNVFGARLKAVRDELKKADKPTDIASRLDAIAEEDSDGDGAANLTEMLAGRFPGDGKDKPTEAESAEATKLRPGFAKYRQSYPWRPFQRVARPEVPAVKNAAWVRNPIDAFIAAQHEERGLKPRPEAPKHVLLRRVTLDLTGLQPTPDAMQAFLDDPAPDAYEKAVDKLLASPAHGERWGRHWMDVWRYSDWAGWTGGNQIRDSQPHIWRWRDWIVESLNEDKGYDRMVLEMLAADELAPDDPKALRATGYLVRNFKMLSREKWLQDTVDHTSQAFLGVTMGCARCHDHMFDDQITQKDYYRLRAIFEPHQVRTDHVPGEMDPKKDGLVRVYDADLEAKTYFYIRGDERTPDKSSPIGPGVPRGLGGRFPDIEPVKLPSSAYAPEKREFVVKQAIAGSEAGVARAREALIAARRSPVPAVVLLAGTGGWNVVALQRPLEMLALAELEVSLAEARHAALLSTIRAEQMEDAGQKETEEGKRAATEANRDQRKHAILEARKILMIAEQALRNGAPAARSDLAKKVDAAAKALAKAVADEKLPPSTTYTKRPGKAYPTTSTGRRLALARWIADRENPLTARVAVNHMWLRHFNQALVPRVFDFGRNGPLPTHPALLDWLAVEFVERGWNMKAMHRLIVTSATYRLASTPDAASASLDRDNRYYWRMSSRRMEAEVVRDSLFQLAGKLDPTMYGPDIDHNQGLTLPRRSIYFRHAQEKQMEFLKLFDGASPTECYQRYESVMPQQALALANSDLAIKHGRLVARALHAQVGADADRFVKAAFLKVLSRPVTAAELAECIDFLQEQARRYEAIKVPPPKDEGQPSADPQLRAREGLIHVLLNHHDFVTIR